MVMTTPLLRLLTTTSDKKPKNTKTASLAGPLAGNEQAGGGGADAAGADMDEVGGGRGGGRGRGRGRGGGRGRGRGEVAPEVGLHTSNADDPSIVSLKSPGFNYFFKP
jgi:hypothetical protein